MSQNNYSSTWNPLPLQGHWNDFLSSTEADFYQLKVGGIISFGGLIYFGLGTIFAIMDFTQKPAFLRYTVLHMLRKSENLQ